MKKMNENKNRLPVIRVFAAFFVVRTTITLLITVGLSMRYCAGQSMNRVVINNLQGNVYINLAEVKLFFNNVQISTSSLYFFLSSTFTDSNGVYTADKCNNGDITDLCHTGSGDSNPSLTILSAAVFDTVKVYNRWNNYLYRIEGATITSTINGLSSSTLFPQSALAEYSFILSSNAQLTYYMPPTPIILSLPYTSRPFQWCVDDMMSVRVSGRVIQFGGAEPNGVVHTTRTDCNGVPQGWMDVVEIDTTLFQLFVVNYAVIGGDNICDSSLLGCACDYRYLLDSSPAICTRCKFGCNGAQKPVVRITVQSIILPTAKATVMPTPLLIPTLTPTFIVTTTSPSSSSTLPPSAHPITNYPSNQPTTSYPTHSPTLSPSLTPSTLYPSTKSPSLSPSSSFPSAYPTTDIPSNQPTTSYPTNSPTLLPSLTPTTSSPTLQPTQLPTSNPTQSWIDTLTYPVLYCIIVGFVLIVLIVCITIFCCVMSHQQRERATSFTSVNTACCLRSPQGERAASFTSVNVLPVAKQDSTSQYQIIQVAGEI